MKRNKLGDRIYLRWLSAGSNNYQIEVSTKKRVLIWVGNVFLVLLATVCTMGTLTSAFELWSFELVLFPAFLILTLVFTAVAARWFYRGLLICLPAVVLVLILWAPAILSVSRFIISVISLEYNTWSSIPALFYGAEATTGDQLTFWAVFGTVQIYLLSFTICLRRSASHTFLITFLPIFPSLFLNYCIPNPVFLIGLGIVYLSLMMSSAYDQPDARKRNRSAFPALALALVLLSLAFFVAPPHNYSRSGFIDSLDDRIRDFLKMDNSGSGESDKDLLESSWPNRSSSFWYLDTTDVAVADAGIAVIRNREILTVVASQSGTFYLRGYSLHDFDGRSWHKSKARYTINDEAPLREYVPGEYIDRELTVTTNQGSYVVRVPYPFRSTDVLPTIAEVYGQLYPETAPGYATMIITNIYDHTGIIYYPYYSFSYDADFPYEVGFYVLNNSPFEMAKELELSSIDLVINFEDYNSWVQQTYTTIDSVTAAKLQALAAEAGIYADADRREIANQVAQYVSTSATYTLSPPVFPVDEDFAVCFLQTAREGYCIHFATAATLMLRALDVPARITFGFVAHVPANKVGQSVSVTDGDAHAWVEVYYEGIGWMPLEVTGSSSSSVESVTENSTDSDEVSAQGGSSGILSILSELSGFLFSRKGALCILCCVIVGVMVLLVRRFFVRMWRARSFAQADTSAAVLAAWWYITQIGELMLPPQLCEELALPPQPVEELALPPQPVEELALSPQPIEKLALKARFSQHCISEDERTVVIDFANKFAENTYSELKHPKRLLMKYIRALY